MKHVHACLSAREDRESSFHHCGNPLIVRGSAVKHVEDSVRPRAYRQSSFHRCGGPVWLVQACLCAGKA